MTMNTTKPAHTPGPWKRETRNMVSGPQGCLLARVTKADESDDVADAEQQEANAALIAAAPEFYEGAVEVVEWLDLVKQNYPDMSGLIRGMQTLKAAIAKAKGTFTAQHFSCLQHGL